MTDNLVDLQLKVPAQVRADFNSALEQHNAKLIVNGQKPLNQGQFFGKVWREIQRENNG